MAALAIRIFTPAAIFVMSINALLAPHYSPALAVCLGCSILILLSWLVPLIGIVVSESRRHGSSHKYHHECRRCKNLNKAFQYSSPPLWGCSYCDNGHCLENIK